MPSRRELTAGAGTPDQPERRDWLTLILAALIPLTAALILFQANVPLGCPGRLIYLYTPVWGGRLAAQPWMVMLAALSGGAIIFLAAGALKERRIALGMLAIGVLGVAIWNYWAPPAFVGQHVMNGESPSQDGAFLREAKRVTSVGEYLATFPQRARTPPDDPTLRGTRIISNPPGTTILAVFARYVIENAPALDRWIEDGLGIPEAEFAMVRRDATVALVFFVLLNLIWLASVPLWYAIGRMYFTAPIAAAFAVCAFATPMTLMFAPGKDAAQLFTNALCVWLALAAYRRRSFVLAACAGFCTALVCAVGLVHVWVMICVIGAMALRVHQTVGWSRFSALLASALFGGFLGVLILRAAGLDLLATLSAVAKSQSAVTRGPNAMSFYWQLLGIPLFILFAGVALWWPVLRGIAMRRCSDSIAASIEGATPDPPPANARFGRALLIVTGCMLAGTSIFTNIETPRLWIPFAPLLMLGAWLQIAWMRASTAPAESEGKRATKLAAALVALQLVAGAAQWSLMDMRETEYRLASEQYFDAPYPTHPANPQ